MFTRFSVTHPLFIVVDCPSPCSLDDFLVLADKAKIADWDTACGNTVAPTTPPPGCGGLTQGKTWPPTANNLHISWNKVAELRLCTVRIGVIGARTQMSYRTFVPISSSTMMPNAGTVVSTQSLILRTNIPDIFICQHPYCALNH